MMFFDVVISSDLHVGKDGYIPLYPLLTEFRDKSLAVMPEKLRQRVKDAVPSWDEIADQDSMLNKTGELTTRQKRIRWFDIKRDVTQEWETYIALQGYIHGGYSTHSYPPGGFVPGCTGFMRGYLTKQIDQAKKNMNESVANVLYNEVALPLDKISREVGIHWPNPDPLLWTALSKFREMNLSSLIKIAEEKNDKLLVDELKFTFTYIYRILNLQRHRMNPQIEAEWIANAGVLDDAVFENDGKFTTKEKINSNFFENEKVQLIENVLDNEKYSPIGIVGGIRKSNNIDLNILSPKQQKLDALAVEIDAILNRNPKLKPSQVKALLRERAGKVDSPIVGVTPGCIQWERDNGGDLVETENKHIDKRIKRWKVNFKLNAHITPACPPSSREDPA